MTFRTPVTASARPTPHRRLSTLWLVVLAACRPPGESHGEHGDHVEHGEHAHEEHAHEERHDQLPRTVAISEEVIAAAGIETTVAAPRGLHPTVRLPGQIIAPPDRQSAAAALVDGVVTSITVQPGDTVERGDVLATVRAPNLQSLRAVAASLDARANAARANAKRLSTLAGKKLASAQEALAATAEADALDAEAEGARKRLRALGISGSGGVTFEVRAPQAGVVLDRPVTVGAPVTEQTVVATVVSTEDVWFQAHLFERDIPRVASGAQVSVRLNAYPDTPFAGEVAYISHQVDPEARTLSARVPLPNPDGRLRLGLFGTAHVVTSDATQAPVLAVPNQSITRIADAPVVFVRHEDGHFEVHDVVLGRSDHAFTEIVHGVRDGEHVVSEGAFAVKSVLLRDTFGEDHH